MLNAMMFIIAFCAVVQIFRLVNEWESNKVKSRLPHKQQLSKNHKRIAMMDLIRSFFMLLGYGCFAGGVILVNWVLIIILRDRKLDKQRKIKEAKDWERRMQRASYVKLDKEILTEYDYNVERN